MAVVSSIPGTGMENVLIQCAEGKKMVARSEDDVHGLTDQLCYINFRQWALEDEVREPSLTAEETVSVVKKIQSSNSDRTNTIELIDRCFVDAQDEALQAVRVADNGVGTNGDDSATVLESHLTLGQILDALTILHVRKFHTEKLLDEGLEYHPFGGYPIVDALQAIDQQINFCQHSFERLHNLFIHGKAVLPPLNYFKMYGRPAEEVAV